MRKLLLFSGLLLLILTANGQTSSRKRAKKFVKQGICGTVVEKRGNHMPTVDKPAPAGQPVEREVLIYAVLKTDQVTMSEDGFYSNLPAQPVKTARTDKRGKFCIYGLPTGTYSVLVRESKGLYANLFDIDGRINPVTVKKQKVASVTVEISHGAVF
ncbi:carboxypeptidase-like regulatory domain-containing protein [Spirosoma montaniterrae]|uniref:Carboxypeptidase regulatory-like domain-containing protein n=1 Tax=Spirosoma montaniterrae TaxID=1178516 RepID=A0A1P9X373_9BACT|nr:carboxypeptidase-like regulatory domain-containing protein [Spirosoma montaniterrae]AQG82051.1 hypothetical protein AWR27_23800 [Spirosoma montaniterrae]